MDLSEGNKLKHIIHDYPTELKISQILLIYSLFEIERPLQRSCFTWSLKKIHKIVMMDGLLRRQMMILSF